MVTVDSTRAGGDLQRRVAGHVSPVADGSPARPRQRLFERLASRSGIAVKAGELLAEIETPELDQEVAEGEVARP